MIFTIFRIKVEEKKAYGFKGGEGPGYKIFVRSS